MASEFKLPELGENVHGGDVLRVLVKAGDSVTVDQPVLELETDKATIEVPSSIAGTVKGVSVKAGEKVKVGQTILVLDEAGAAPSGNGGSPAKPEAESRKPEAVSREPEAGSGQPEAGSRQPGAGSREPEAVSREPEAGSREPEAVSRKPEAVSRKPEAAPQPVAIARAPEDEIVHAPKSRRGEVVDISRGPRAAAQGVPAPAESGPAPAAAPSVRRIAREFGVDIRHLTGTGPGGRITVEDVQAYVREALSSGPSAAPAASGAAPAAQPLPDFAKWGDVERKPINNIRRKTAEHLSHVWNVVPAVTQYDKADITALEELRKKYSPMAERAGGKMTVTAIALKVLAGAIRKFPQFAASLDMAKGQLVYKKYAHIGVAVDTDRGLLVAVIRDVDKKGVVELSAELAKISEKARAGKLTLDEMSGGVITISNLGGIGGVGFSPIVNWPEVAILGISRGSHEPVWNGSAFQPRLMLPLSLSYDHRVIDGADAARFLRWVCDAFEQPFVLSL
jgi:pyruvate dehydrogenase E2 component (dihydrolipoyllysine-residue acetyltransferase)